MIGAIIIGAIKREWRGQWLWGWLALMLSFLFACFFLV